MTRFLAAQNLASFAAALFFAALSVASVAPAVTLA